MTSDHGQEDGARFHSAVARTGVTLVGRLLPGSDLIRGLEAVCEHHGVKYAAVNFAYGSLSSAGFKTLQMPDDGSNRPTLTLETVDSRVEFLGGQGLVCSDGLGGRATHLHGSISDETGRVLGGHFEPGLNPVYNNMDFTLQELLDVELVREWDTETATVEMRVVQMGDQE
ncbi:PPC domain-containing DNA-binding protein [Nocardioides sp. YIM 152315]|uniref:PPC domain-containing DNA-binding protein n=1 Tax=Nocardioides sp. YIM 152315 TaxID=3031760 RepID=UPI0023D9E271|nr:PPC domain-containing DNA-binding protein [Nocardioides sp. YIM 152315]MDF1605828.1 DNA-binding protein [Nocardioides sp. YIM 152315]